MADIDEGPRLSGWSGNKKYFRFVDLDSYDGDQLDSVIEVLNGRLLGVIYRGVVAPEVRQGIASAFWASDDRKTRGAEAPGFYLGTYHYHKPTDVYLSESEASRDALNAVVAGPADPLEGFYGRLSLALGRAGASWRLAEKSGREACRGLLRSWHGGGEYSLAPHDDRSQCLVPEQVDFEIQKVASHNVAALNICLENGGGGRLAMWNVQPDNATKTRLGLELTGSPYPVEELDGIEMLWLDVRPGDVYIFNGAHVHAVEPNTDSSARRTTLAGMFGFVNDTTVVSWT